MSKEIRTPLNAILGYAQILRADRSLGEAHRHAVETVERSGNHLLALINDILDISKIEAGFKELALEDFNLGDLVGDLSRMFELRCRQKNLRLEVRAELADRFVHGDQNKLRQILTNLMGNAVKFTDEGSVSLLVQIAEDDRFRFVVTDTGPGIASNRQQEIFEPFQKEGTNTSIGGTGLGLAIAREHVGLMGGELLLESIPGSGSVFSFELSLPDAHGAPPVASEQNFTSVTRLLPGQQVRVLVVDDVDENRGGPRTDPAVCRGCRGFQPGWRRGSGDGTAGRLGSGLRRHPYARDARG